MRQPPDLIMVIDALAARSTKRLNRTIQISDAEFIREQGLEITEVRLQRYDGNSGHCNRSADSCGCRNHCK